MSSVFAFVEHERGAVDEVGQELLTVGRQVAAELGATLEAVVVGDGADDALATLGAHGAQRAYIVAHPDLSSYAPAAYAECLVQLMATHQPVAVLASGTEKGNEVLAHVAARTDLPMAANCAEVTTGGAGSSAEPWTLTRLRWGGSLLEDSQLEASTKLLSVAAHAFQAAELDDAVEVEAERFEPRLDGAATAVRVVAHEPSGAGVSLASAPVVVSGGRGVGGPEGFAVLEQLADLLDGAVGCSRVATNNGWRSHSDQVGQTGTKIAPQLYVACGISGATQHWVGCKDSKNILAINTDADAPLVTRGDYAVIGSLQEVLPAIVEEVRRRKSA